jgi:hypothetical protein
MIVSVAMSPKSGMVIICTEKYSCLFALCHLLYAVSVVYTKICFVESCNNVERFLFVILSYSLSDTVLAVCTLQPFWINIIIIRYTVKLFMIQIDMPVSLVWIDGFIVT